MTLRCCCIALMVAAGCYAQGVISTLAGTDWVFAGDSRPALDVPLGDVRGVATGKNGSFYVTDRDNGMLMRVDADGVLHAVAGNGLSWSATDGGPALGMALGLPEAVAADTAGNLFVISFGCMCVRKITPDGTMTRVAGSGSLSYSGDGGPAIKAGLNPFDVVVDAAGNLYIADYTNNRVRKVAPDGLISTIAGNGQPASSGDGGPAREASLNAPSALALDNAGNLYIFEGYGTTTSIRKVSPDGTIRTVDKLSVRGMVTDANGNLYATRSDSVYRIAPDGTRTIVASGFGEAYKIALDETGAFYVADSRDSVVRKISPAGQVTTIAGNGRFRFSADGTPATSAFLYRPQGILAAASGEVFIADNQTGRLKKVTTDGRMYTVVDMGKFSWISAVAMDRSGALYVAAYSLIYKIASGGAQTVFAGGGAPDAPDGVSARSIGLMLPEGLAFDAAGNLYIADSVNHRVRKVKTDGTAVTVAGTGQAGFSGDGGPGPQAALNHPSGVVLDAAGNLYIADCYNQRVRKLTPDGVISTVAGTGVVGFSGDLGPAKNAQLNYPRGLVLDGAGQLYIADSYNHRVRKVAPDGTISTVAGTRMGFSGDGGPATNAALNVPFGLAIDGKGNFLISDSWNDRIRVVLASTVSFQASPAAVTFSVSSGGAAPAPASVSLSSTVPGLAFTTAVNTTSGGNWLGATPQNGTMPAALQIAVDPSQLGPGDYDGAVTITAPDANPKAQTIGVRLSVAAAQAPDLRVDNASLSFALVKGSAGTFRQLTVLNRGGGAVDFTASVSTTAGGDWLQVSPTGGRATAAAPASLTVRADPGTLAAGTYSGGVKISGAGAELIVPVTLALSEMRQKLLLSQTGLSFTAVAGGGTPAPQSFGILNEGQGTMNWTATARTLSGGDWLRLATAAGQVTRPLLDVSMVEVRVNTPGLAAGEYYGQIQVSAASENSPQLITVVLKVLPEGSDPGPDLQPNGLIFTAVQGATPGSQDVMVTNVVSKALSYVSSGLTFDGAAWFAHLPAVAAVRPNEPVRIVVQPDSARLSPGVRRGVITLIFDGGAIRTVSVLGVVAPPGGSALSKLRERLAAGCGSNLRVEFTSLPENFTATVGQPTNIETKVVDDCGNPLVADASAAAAVLARFSSGDPDLRLVHIGGGKWSGTWRPLSAGTGRVLIAITALLVEGNARQAGQAQRGGTVQAASTTPLLAPGALLHAASFALAAPVAPGGLITLFGANFADRENGAAALPLPNQLEGTEVVLGGQSLPLLYTNSGQINAQVPYSLPVNMQHQVVVRRGVQVSVPESFMVAAAQPGIFTRNQQGTGQGVIFKSDGRTLAEAASPAARGEVIVIYCAGLGAVNPPVDPGRAAPAVEPLARTVNTVGVTIAGQPAQVQFSGLTPGFAGLYQVNAVVPPDTPPGDAVPVTLTVAGQMSRTVTIAVK